MCFSSKIKPKGLIKCRVLLVKLHDLTIFAVFPAISGSNKTILIIYPLLRKNNYLLSLLIIFSISSILFSTSSLLLEVKESATQDLKCADSISWLTELIADDTASN